MREFVGLTDLPKQSIKMQVENGDIVKVSFYYKENQQGWFFDIEYNNFSCKTTQLTNCPNIIRQFQNVLPFGISCSVNDGGEPWFLNDFLTGRVRVFLLNEDEVNYIGQQIYGKIW